MTICQLVLLNLLEIYWICFNISTSRKPFVNLFLLLALDQLQIVRMIVIQ